MSSERDGGCGPACACLSDGDAVVSLAVRAQGSLAAEFCALLLSKTFKNAAGGVAVKHSMLRWRGAGRTQQDG